MGEQKKLIIILGMILIILSGIVFAKIIASRVDEDEIMIDIENKKEDFMEKETTDELMLSEKDAMNLALEQIDINEFSISILHGMKEIEDNKYYLFDLVNKSGPSFAMKLAIDTHTGQMYGYDPGQESLVPMTDFPIPTPIALEQDWNNRFLPVEDQGKAPFAIDLRQRDADSFEFDVIQEGEEAKILLQGAASISGAMATYEAENGFRLIFIKEEEYLKIKEYGLNPLKADQATDGIVIAGSYKEEERNDT